MFLKVKGDTVYLIVDNLKVKDLSALNEAFEVICALKSVALPEDVEECILMDKNIQDQLDQLVEKYAKEYFSLNRHIHIHVMNSYIEHFDTLSIPSKLAGTTTYLYLTFTNSQVDYLDINFSLSELVILNSNILLLHKDDSYTTARITNSKVAISSNYFFESVGEVYNTSNDVLFYIGSDREEVEPDDKEEERVYVKAESIENIILPSELHIDNSEIFVYNTAFSEYAYFCGSNRLIEVSAIGHVICRPTGYRYISELCYENAINTVLSSQTADNRVVGF